ERALVAALREVLVAEPFDDGAEVVLRQARARVDLDGQRESVSRAFEISVQIENVAERRQDVELTWKLLRGALGQGDRVLEVARRATPADPRAAVRAPVFGRHVRVAAAPEHAAR